MIPSSVSLQTLGSLTPFLFVLAAVLLILAFRMYRAHPAAPETGSTRLLLALRLISVIVLVLLLMEPVLSLFAERTRKARIALLVDHSLSMTIPFPRTDSDAVVDADAPEPTRLERTLESLSRDGSDLFAKLKDEGRLEIYGFGGTVTPVADPDAFVRARTEGPPPEDRTDLARALSEAVGSQRSQTGAVVVMSDGSHNVGIDPRTEARRLGVPVYAIGVGSEGPVTDVSVFDVEASGVAYLDNDVPIVAKLRARGDAASDVPVYLSEGGVVLDSTRVDLPGGGVETVRV